jgi:hypothetical protein
MGIVAYIRGGLGDIYPAITAIKSIMEEKKLTKFDVLILTDSVYYFRDYPKELETYSLDMLRKLTPNIIEINPNINRNFWLDKNGKIFDDTTDELSQEEAEKYFDEFMFWRPKQLKDFVTSFIKEDTIFIDSVFTECILKWDFINNRYERVSSDRKKFEFNPTSLERQFINGLLRYPKHILIHVRKKVEGDAHTEQDNFYEKIISYCNSIDVVPILIGVDGFESIKNNKVGYCDLLGSGLLSFEGMGYLIDKCDIMLGNDSGFSAIKMYQQQKDKLLIMNYPRWSRNNWYRSAILEDKSNTVILNANEDNIFEICKLIGEYYG